MMEVTRDLYSLNLLVKLMVLRCQILFSLVIVGIAEAILMQTSAEQVPSLHRVAPMYLKVTALMLFLLLVMILLFSCADFHSICCCSV